MKTLFDLTSIKGEVCYLLHFDRPICDSHPTQHYLGSSIKLERRINKHEDNPDARLLQIAKERGIGFTVVKVWVGGRELEKKLKARKNAPCMCPICRAERKAKKLAAKKEEVLC